MEHISNESVSAELEALESEAGSDPVIEAEKEQQAISQQENIAEWREIVSGLATPGFAILAPGWNIQPQEIEALAESYAIVLDKYFPEGPLNIGPELGAAMLTVAIFAPRMKMPRKLPEKSENKPEKGEDSGG